MQQHQNSLVSLLNEYPKACRAALAIALMGSVSLASHKLTDGNKINQSQVIDVPKLENLEVLEKPAPAAIQPTPKTQIVIVVPNNEQQLDCVRFGGGMGCFDSNYQPQPPNYYFEDKPEEPRRGSPRSVDWLYRFW